MKFVFSILVTLVHNFSFADDNLSQSDKNLFLTVSSAFVMAEGATTLAITLGNLEFAIEGSLPLSATFATAFTGQFIPDKALIKDDLKNMLENARLALVKQPIFKDITLEILKEYIKQDIDNYLLFERFEHHIPQSIVENISKFYSLSTVDAAIEVRKALEEI